MAYTVQPGESYWSIAQKLLGDGSRWKEIADMNGGGGTIHPGQTLSVPGQSTEMANQPAPGTANSGAGLPVPEGSVPGPYNPAGTDLLQDPTYAAYLRAMGFNESQIESQLASQLDSIDRAIKRQEPMFTDQKDQALRNDTLSWENRGLFGSGARLRETALNQNRIDRNRLDYLAGQSDQQAQLQRDAAGQVAQLRRDRAEQELNARGRLTQRDIGAVYG